MIKYKRKKNMNIKDMSAEELLKYARMMNYQQYGHIQSLAPKRKKQKLWRSKFVFRSGSTSTKNGLNNTATSNSCLDNTVQN